MPHHKDTQLPPAELPPPRNPRLFWFAGLALGVLAGIVVAIELVSLGGH